MASAAKPEMDKKQVVEHILRYKHNYYSLLQVPRTCTAAEVSVAYKKMALKCHPDKNEHPQAAEAFKVLGAARDVLTNPELRQAYVRRGEEGVRQQESGMRPRRPGQGVRPGMHGDPFEDFFANLFSGGNFFQEGNGGARYYYSTSGAGGAGRGGNTGPYRTSRPRDGRGQAAQDNRQQGDPGNFLLFIPLVMFIIMVLVMQSGWETMNPNTYGSSNGKGPVGKQGERVFSLTPLPDAGMVVRRTTSLFNTNVEYYTSHKHLHLLSKRESLLRIEREVLKEKKISLERRCTADRHNNRAGGRKEVPESCEEFQRLSHALG